IMFDRGISYEGDLLDLGVLHGLVLKSGTLMSFKHPKEGEIRLGQGREKARQLLIDNPELAKEIDAQIRSKLIGKDPLPGMASTVADDEADELRPAPAAAGAPNARPAPGKPAKV
ncbi:MAG: DNA recombination/repair protein RecA, partial [Planctomycetota bacterium]|nr:DNA recombination/repair protein RecA [Planctomycetota bacterium]